MSAVDAPRQHLAAAQVNLVLASGRAMLDMDAAISAWSAMYL